MIWFLIILFGILSLILLSGHGGFLIAGYNTASKEQKKKYNKKKLCRVTGASMGFITVILAVLASFGDHPPNWLLSAIPVLMLGNVAVMLLVGNFCCKAKPEEAEPESVSPETKARERLRQKRTTRFSLLFTLAVFVIVGIFLFTGHVQVTLDQDTLSIEGSYWPDYQIPLSEIQNMDYRTSFSRGRRTNGLGSFKLVEGNFSNSEFGNYLLYAYLGCDHHIVLETDRGILVVNGETEEETQELWQTLQVRLKEE